jgi:signal transduction histidine kinase
MAHDFNNLLGVVLMYNALLARQIDEPTMAADLAEVREAAEHAVAMTRDLLTFAARTLCSPEIVRVDELVIEVAPRIREVLGDGTDLHLQLAQTEAPASVDPRQLERILLNLTENARDAMPDGGVLTIATGQVASRRPSPDGQSHLDVTLQLTDTGVGMPPDVLGRAFEPYFTTRPGRLGAGLGLSVVYGLARQNSTDISISSIPGVGTTVTLVLPCAHALDESRDLEGRSG